jgi:hypothetical protein
MRHQPPRKPDIARVNAVAQSLKLWVLEIIAWVTGLAGVKFRPDIAEEIYAAKLCVFLNAVHRCDQRGRVFMRRHWRGAAPGFRYRFQRAQLRAFTRVVKIRGLKISWTTWSPPSRVLRQLRKSAIHTHLVPVAPAAERGSAAITGFAVEAADTS